MVDMDGPLMSSEKDDYETPQDLFDNLDSIYHFTLDAAASPRNAKCDRFYTEEDNGLVQKWEGIVWVNPPYGRRVTGIWVDKAIHETVVSGAFICMLLPARTDTRWFHKILNSASAILFIKGRLRFVGEASAAPFPSMLVFFDGPGNTPLVYSADKQGNIIP